MVATRLKENPFLYKATITKTSNILSRVISCAFKALLPAKILLSTGRSFKRKRPVPSKVMEFFLDNGVGVCLSVKVSIISSSLGI